MRGAARVVEALHGVGRDIRLGIEIEDAVLDRPGDAILKREAAAEVDADPVLEAHRRCSCPRLKVRPGNRACRLGAAILAYYVGAQVNIRLVGSSVGALDIEALLDRRPTV